MRQADHESHRSFTFTLLAPSRAEALGCLYLNSLREYLCRAGADQAVVDAFPPTTAMVTFWLRQDQQDNGLAEVVAETVNDWLLNCWPLGSHVFRVLPDERSSRRALQRLNLLQTHLTLPGDDRPYLWFSRPSDPAWMRRNATGVPESP